jgi:hypothetical protein
MIDYEVRHGLPFVSVSLNFRGKSMMLHNVLLDTGSASTIFKIDLVDAIGVKVEPHDIADVIRGIGGTEYVFAKIFDRVSLGSIEATSFLAEIGLMDYGFDIDGIIGYDFIESTGICIDAQKRIISIP